MSGNGLREGDLTYILWTDLVNEPFAGNSVNNPSLLLPGVGDKVNLQNFYERINTAIREVDPTSIVTYESVTWDNVGVGFTSPPGGSATALKTAHNWHYYIGAPNVQSVEVTTRQRVKDASRLGTGSILSEFSINHDCGEICNLQHVEQMEAAESAQISWIGWQYKSYVPITGSGPGLFDEDTGEPYDFLVPVYSRPYPPAISGHLLSFKYNMTTRHFKLRYAVEPQLRFPTEITVNKVHYPDGFDVVVRPVEGVWWGVREDEEVVEVWAGEGIKWGTVVGVEVMPKGEGEGLEGKGRYEWKGCRRGGMELVVQDS
ncbi:hypothetical protein HDV00_003900 [Rhizophlyctis rosea]|nr:hypothetical protein HDV00_003900 [Rhizophlyctis rosea]